MGKTIKAVIADRNKETCQLLNDALSAERDFIIAGTVGDGLEALELVKRTEPDILIMDFMLSTLDGIAVLEKLGELGDRRPETLIVTAVSRQSILNTALNLGASYILHKPFDPRIVVERCRQITDPTPIVWERSRSAEELVTEILLKLGMATHMKGFRYFRTAILLAIDDMELIYNVTKMLYPTVAKRYRTNSDSVERAMRHAVDESWGKGDADMIRWLFGRPMSLIAKPTNSELVALIADRVYLYLKDLERRKRII